MDVLNIIGDHTFFEGIFKGSCLRSGNALKKNEHLSVKMTNNTEKTGEFRINSEYI